MSTFQYGCDKAEYGGMSATGAMTSAVEMDIHQDTIQHNEGTPTATKHYKQGNGRAKVIRYANADETVSFNIMDMSAASKAVWLGGTVTTLDNKSTWNKPKGKKKPTEKSLKYYLEDGSIIYIPKASCMATLVNNYNDSDIAVITVVAEVMDCGLDDVSDFQWTDASED